MTEDLELLNAMATEQINKLEQESNKPSELVPQIHSSRGDFWSKDYVGSYHSPHRPQNLIPAPTIGSTPRSYSSFRRGDYFSGSYGDSPEGIFRRTVNAVYKAESKESKESKESGRENHCMEEVERVKISENKNSPSSSSVIGGSLFDSNPMKKVQREELRQPDINKKETVEPPRFSPEYRPPQPQISYRQPIPRKRGFRVSSNTKKQWAAVILSSVAKAAVIGLTNWAKEEGVPLELIH